MCLQSSSSMKNVFRGMYTLFVGAGMARALGLLSMPLLTRIYGPTSFGSLAIFVALATQLTPFLTLRYTLAIPLPSRDGRGFNLMVFCLILIALFTLASLLVLMIFAAPILRWLQADAILAYWLLIPFGAAAMAIFELLSLWATRQRDYRIIARAQVRQTILGESTKIALGVIGLHSLGLILGQITSQVSGALIVLLRFRATWGALRGQLSGGRMLFMARRYRDFPLLRLPSQVLLGFATQAPLLFASALYDTATAGQFALAMTAMALPMSLIGRTMSQAYYGEIAKAYHDPETLWRISLSVQVRLFVFAIPFALLLIFAAEPLFALVFGEAWREAGRFTSVLAIFIVLQLTSAPLMQVLDVLERQRDFLALNVVRVIGLGGIYLLAMSKELDSMEFVAVVAVFSSVYYAIASVYVMAAIWIRRWT